MRTNIDINYDRNLAQRCNTTTGDTITTDTPSLFKNNDYLFEVQLYDAWPTTSNVASITTWVAGIGKLDTTPYVEALNAVFNLVEDAYADTTDGKISFRVNTASAALDTDLGTSTQKQYYCEIRGDDGVSVGTIMLVPIIVKNTIY